MGQSNGEMAISVFRRISAAAIAAGLAISTLSGCTSYQVAATLTAFGAEGAGALVAQGAASSRDIQPAEVNQNIAGMVVPTNTLLWNSGDEQTLYHCFYNDSGGSIKYITLGGLIYAGDDFPYSKLALSGTTSSEAASSRGDLGKMLEVYLDQVVARTGQNPEKALEIVAADVRADADCLNRSLKQVNNSIVLSRQGIFFVWDDRGAAKAVDVGMTDLSLEFSMLRLARIIGDNAGLLETKYAEIADGLRYAVTLRAQAGQGSQPPPATVPSAPPAANISPSVPASPTPKTAESAAIAAPMAQVRRRAAGLVAVIEAKKALSRKELCSLTSNVICPSLGAT